MTWWAWLLTLWLTAQLPFATAWHLYIDNRKHQEGP